MKKVRTFLAEDHTIVRKAIRALLEKEAGIEVVGEASTGFETVSQCEVLKPDVVLMDISMPDMNGVEATRQIIKTSPKTKVVVLSVHKEQQYIFPALRAGARGYVLKDDIVEDLLVAINVVAKGNSFFSPTIQDHLLRDYIRTGEDAQQVLKPDPLTPREKQILQLIAEEHTNKRIAAKLNISLKTVQAHRTNIMEKLDIHSAAGLTKYAIATGLIEKPGSN
ncbi:response regulator transcription factor [candidate division TA06 bacterium]|uniref:Response regulator transcription factor n=1 Tax=candidate division TA06 bacterium TaxID=2250710 RepID=A0A523XQL4_UNCT6|nr:MAG: response regulator transcription factor [candidate division TA06 bacterium]